ncbi:unnamed protein product, partial [marine sediment metagenome]
PRFAPLVKFWLVLDTDKGWYSYFVGEKRSSAQEEVMLVAQSKMQK